MLTRIFLGKCFWILMNLYKMFIFFINKDHGKRNLLCILFYILKCACRKRVNIDPNKVNSCDFSGSGLYVKYIVFQHFLFKSNEMKQRGQY